MKNSFEGSGNGFSTITTGSGSGTGTGTGLATDIGGSAGETTEGVTAICGGGTKLLVARIPPGGPIFLKSISISG